MVDGVAVMFSRPSHFLSSHQLTPQYIVHTSQLVRNRRKRVEKIFQLHLRACLVL